MSKEGCFEWAMVGEGEMAMVRGVRGIIITATAILSQMVNHCDYKMSNGNQ